jgi:hypothetical protein
MMRDDEPECPIPVMTVCRHAMFALSDPWTWLRGPQTQTLLCLVPGVSDVLPDSAVEPVVANEGRAATRRKARTRNPRFFGTAVWIPGSRAAHPPRNYASRSTQLGRKGLEPCETGSDRRADA